MDLYIVCECGREWWYNRSDLLNGITYCTECGEELRLEDMSGNDDDVMGYMPIF